MRLIEKLTMSRILLINPDPVPRILPPLGLCCIAQNLIKHGHEAIIYDNGFDKKLDLHNIDFIGVTATTLIYFDAKKQIEEIKSISPYIPIIIGGMHASVLPEYVLENSGADAVVVGEGDDVMVKIANKEIEPKGIIKAPIIENLDDLPFLTYEYLDLNRYFKFKGADRIRWSLPQPSIAMIGNRGCPFICTFCASQGMFGKKIRFRSVKHVMQEIDFLREKFKVKSIYFYDDTLTLKRNWMIELCAELEKRNIKWICGTRVDTVNESMLRLMKKSGCKYISYGIESGSERMLKDVIKKGFTLNRVEEIINLTNKIGIGVIANYMFGLPFETEEDMKMTYEFSKKIHADAAEFNVYTPLPGTELSAGLDWSVYSSDRNPFHSKSQIHTPEFAKIIKYYHHKSIKSFYLSPRYLLGRTKMLAQPRQLLYSFKSFFRLISNIIKS